MSPKMIEAMNLFRTQDTLEAMALTRQGLGRAVGTLCRDTGGRAALLQYTDREPKTQIARTVTITQAGRDWLRQHNRAGDPT